MDSLQSNCIEEEELLPFLRERLAAGQSIRYLPFRGVSMLPMLRQGKDSVELSPLPPKLKKYDLPVYQYPSGKVVMHRVVGVKHDHYVCLGDNLVHLERIYPEQLIGVVTAFKRGERRIETDNLGYRLYSRVWVWLFPVRWCCKGAKAVLKQILRRLMK